MLTEDLSTFHLDEDSLGTELVNSIPFSEEEGSELVRISRSIDVFSKSQIDIVVIDWNVGLGSSLEFKNQSLQVDDVLNRVKTNLR